MFFEVQIWAYQSGESVNEKPQGLFALFEHLQRMTSTGDHCSGSIIRPCLNLQCLNNKTN